MSTLSPPEVMALTQQPVDRLQDPIAVLLAYGSLYAQRGGGVASAITGDTQGLGMTQRNQKRLAAPQMVVQLHALAHTTMVWARHGLTPSVSMVKRWGILRLVRDVLHSSGRLAFDPRHGISHIILNRADPLSKRVITGLWVLLESEHIAVTLGEI